MTKTKLCPICKKPRDHALKQRSGSANENPHSPFCSSRCRDRDLTQWFGDGYAVPGRPALPDEIAQEVASGDEPDRD